MSSKAQILKMLEKVPDDEPLFLVRGQDIIGPLVVSGWATLAEQIGAPQEKANQARTCAIAMTKYHKRKIPD